ncbi:hypothetical protein Scep_012379 [Stephania cephalantha]|uniref:Uncharacterized protein n=1 Tax=Stephania cephalantha TaxID=152367 RepID=A0AAP0P9T1_9MAGN
MGKFATLFNQSQIETGGFTGFVRLQQSLLLPRFFTDLIYLSITYLLISPSRHRNLSLSSSIISFEIERSRDSGLGKSIKF